MQKLHYLNLKLLITKHQTVQEVVLACVIIHVQHHVLLDAEALVLEVVQVAVVDVLEDVLDVVLLAHQAVQDVVPVVTGAVQVDVMDAKVVVAHNVLLVLEHVQEDVKALAQDVLVVTAAVLVAPEVAADTV